MYKCSRMLGLSGSAKSIVGKMAPYVARTTEPVYFSEGVDGVLEQG